jgi:hypothetical protein
MKTVKDIKRLLTSTFETELLDASIASLTEIGNKLRYNNFAYSIRELSRHFLHRLAPDEYVKKCSWYKIETLNDKPTRPQRIKYAIQGGITDEQLEDWGFDIDDLNETIKEIKTTIDDLSKYTHINPDVFNISEAEVEKYSSQALTTFKNLVIIIETYRKDLKSFLNGHIEDHMISSVVSSFFENVDSLAPHHSLDYCEVNKYHISEINDQEIVVDVSGDLHVTLEYGSRQERREGDGLDIKQSFPFTTKIRYEIEDNFPSEKHEIDDYGVDTLSWYEGNEFSNEDNN